MLKRFLTAIILAIAIGAFIGSSYVLYQRMNETKESENTYSVLRDSVYTVRGSSETDEERQERLENLYSLYWENTDLIGWVQIPDTKIDYPVMQNIKEPDYYLKRDFYGNKSSFGCIYMDASCNPGISKNQLLYGHHMKNGDMFAGLDSYLSETFCLEHPYIQFDLLSAVQDYEIIGAFKIKQSEISGLQDMILFQTEEDFNSFNQFFEEHKFYDTGVSYSYDDSFLTLMTCEYTTKNGRLFVLSKKIQ